MLKPILAIDTSCDETAAAVTLGQTLLSTIIASQADLHKPYGGVFPTVAKLAHRENILPIITLAIKRARVDWNDISAIAVTQGPGLAPALEVGIATAIQLAQKYQIPLLPVYHIEGHLLSVLVLPRGTKTPLSQPNWPVLGLIISGGHSQFVRIQDFGHYETLGHTLDDAAGECLDKVGRMLNLGYPAGPVIETFANYGDYHSFEFPLPMTTSGDYNLSFSGLKTFARNTLSKLTDNFTKPISRQQTYNFCAAIQYAVFRHICYKLEKILTDAAKSDSLPTTVWLGGGVAANSTLRAMIRQTLKPYGLRLKTPYSKRLCGDNAAMIGVTAFLHPQLNDQLKIDRQPRMKL